MLSVGLTPFPWYYEPLRPFSPADIFWFYGDTFPWPSELLRLRAKQMVLEQGWATTAQQKDDNEDEVTTAPLISHAKLEATLSYYRKRKYATHTKIQR